MTGILQWQSCHAVRSVMDDALGLYQISAAIESVRLVALDVASPCAGYVWLPSKLISTTFVDLKQMKQMP